MYVLNFPDWFNGKSFSFHLFVSPNFIFLVVQTVLTKISKSVIQYNSKLNCKVVQTHEEKYEIPWFNITLQRNHLLPLPRVHGAVLCPPASFLWVSIPAPLWPRVWHPLMALAKPTWHCCQQSRQVPEGLWQVWQAVREKRNWFSQP